MGEAGRVWPDGLEVGDSVVLDGHEFEVVGTGPGEATIERIDDDSVTGRLFRWAFTSEVGVELEKSFEQEEFEELVDTRSTPEDKPGGARE